MTQKVQIEDSISKDQEHRKDSQQQTGSETSQLGQQRWFQKSENQSTQNSVCEINIEDNLQDLKQLTGLLVAFWTEQENSITTVSYGTATIVAKRLLLTCTHNVFSQRTRTFCSKILFYPNIDKKSLSEAQRYVSYSSNFIQCTLSSTTTFGYIPQKGELCLLSVEQDLPVDRFIKIGNLPKNKLGQKVFLIGYDNFKYYKNFDYGTVRPQRIELRGQILSVQDDVINYTMKTKKGMSGGAVFWKDDAGSWKIIAIHSHRGQKSTYNCGLYLSTSIIDDLKIFQIKAKNVHNTSTEIQYADILEAVETQYNSEYSIDFSTCQTNSSTGVIQAYQDEDRHKDFHCQQDDNEQFLKAYSTIAQQQQSQ